MWHSGNLLCSSTKYSDSPTFIICFHRVMISVHQVRTVEEA